jgi:hypothetical protein
MASTLFYPLPVLIIPFEGEVVPLRISDAP